MSKNQPFDLGTLADVESPEVVKEALRTFRRRSLRTAVWVMLVGLMIGVPLAHQATTKSFDQRAANAPGYDVGAVYTSRGVTVVLSRVAVLDEGTGLHLIATARDVPGDAVIESVDISPASPMQRYGGPSRVIDGWFVVRAPDDGVVKVTVFVHATCGVHPGKTNPNPGAGCFDPNPPEREFTINLKALGVPERFWKKGAVR